MSNRYTTKTLTLTQLRDLRGELRRDAEAGARKRQLIEQARARDNAWLDLKSSTRPLRLK